MIIKKKEESAQKPLIQPPVVFERSIFTQLDYDLAMAASGAEAAYRVNKENYEERYGTAMSAPVIVENLRQIGKELSAKIKESSTDKNIQKDMLDFTRGAFGVLGHVIRETFPSDGTGLIEDVVHENAMLKIGISAGILSGIASNVSIGSVKEK